MGQTPTQSRILKFGVFEVDLEAGELRKSGMRQNLAGQPFEALRILLEHPQEIVSRKELRQRLWQDNTFVDYDLALKRVINRLREVLGDSADNPRFIETIPRKGYRFIAPVSGTGAATLPAPELPKSSTTGSPAPWRKLQLGIALGLGAAALLGAVLSVIPPSLWRRLSGKNTVPQIRSIAVLPLQNLSSDATQEYFADGMTDALITDLAQIGSLKVISRTSTMRYKKTDKSLSEIARELNVDGIVEGTVQRSGDRVRITAQLIYAPSDRHVWANSYERDVHDILALERDVTGDIARQIQARLTTQKQPPTAEPQVTNLKALEAYLRGNYHLNGYAEGSGDEEKRKAAEYFQQAIETDPNFAAAYIGLTKAHSDLLWPSSGDAEIVRRSLGRALELDPSSSDARQTSGDSKWNNWDWSGAEEEYRRAIALSPNNAHAHSRLCWFLFGVGRGEEGFRECQTAQELDPGQDHLAEALYWQGDYDHAILLRQVMLQRDPNNGYYHQALYRYYAVKGMQEESLQELEKVFSLFGMPQAAARIQHASEVSGYFVGFRQAAKEVEDLQSAQQAYAPVNLAIIYTILWDKDRAFYWLEEAYKHHDTHRLSTDMGLEQLRIDPLFKPLRSDSRYIDLLRRIGLPP